MMMLFTSPSPLRSVIKAKSVPMNILHKTQCHVRGLNLHCSTVHTYTVGNLVVQMDAKHTHTYLPCRQPWKAMCSLHTTYMGRESTLDHCKQRPMSIQRHRDGKRCKTKNNNQLELA